MKLAILAILSLVTAAASGQNGVIWNKDGSYMCSPNQICSMPTKAEIAAHKPTGQQKQPAKQPVDVPPVTEEYGPLGVDFCDMGCVFVPGGTSPFPDGPKPHRQTRFTCADKTRFLMTAEDGRKHCIKLSGKQEER